MVRKENYDPKDKIENLKQSIEKIENNNNAFLQALENLHNVATINKKKLADLKTELRRM